MDVASCDPYGYVTIWTSWISLLLLLLLLFYLKYFMSTLLTVRVEFRVFRTCWNTGQTSLS